MDILFPKSQRMKTCKYHLIYNGVTNNKFDKVYWLKKSESIFRFIYLHKSVIILENLGKQNPF